MVFLSMERKKENIKEKDYEMSSHEYLIFLYSTKAAKLPYTKSRPNINGNIFAKHITLK